MINKFLKYIWRDGECICTKSKSNYYSNHLHDFRKNCLIKMILQCRCWEVLFVHIVFIILLQKKSRFDLNIILNKLMYQVGFQKWKQKKFQLQCIYHLLSIVANYFFTLTLMSQVHAIIFLEFQIYHKNDCFQQLKVWSFAMALLSNLPQRRHLCDNISVETCICLWGLCLWQV